jgi:flagellin
MINTNITSLNAQNNLAKSQNSLATSLQRLSSGLRINSAKDDSAGLAIASRMSAQISGMTQASRNANDAISMSQTAEGAMGQVGDILQRMRDLSVQSANGSNSITDRKTIQNEVDQLTSEIDRISDTTEFNGNKLLNGATANNSFQVGANANQTISFKIAEVSTKSMALNSTTALGELNSGRTTTNSATTGDLLINGNAITFTGSDDTAAEFKTAINNATATTGVTATSYNSLQGTAGATGVTDGSLSIQVGGGNAVTIKASANMSELVDNINKQVGGVTASIGTNGGLSLTNDTGDAIIIGAGSTGGSGLTMSTINNGYLSLSSADSSPITLSSATTASATALNKFGFNGTTANNQVTSAEFLTGATTDRAAATDALVLGQGAVLATDKVKINGVELGATSLTDSSAANKAAAINAIKSQTGVSATATTNAYIATTTANDVTINGAAVTLTANAGTSATAINNAKISGISASVDSASGKLKITSATGNDITIANVGAGVVGATGISTTAGASGTTLSATQAAGVRGQVTLSGENGATVRLEDATSTGTGLAKLGLVGQGGNTEAIGGKLDVSTQANAQNAIKRIDSAISFIATQRSTMGAVQNRMSSAISNLASSSENITAARSRIQDADFATETANLTRGQILQQAGTAMLAQANSLPNGVLALLR